MAEAAKAAEAAAVATARADNNQQRAVKTAAAVITVGKRRQARLRFQTTIHPIVGGSASGEVRAEACWAGERVGGHRPIV